jgi:tetratricopeptide (TPR) repeat protein/DNA-binding XRE family transcriptional regulator
MNPRRHEPDDLALALSLVRWTRGLAQGELAAAAGVELSSVKAIEQGRRPRRKLKTVEDLASALEIDLRALGEVAALIGSLRGGHGADRGRHEMRVFAAGLAELGGVELRREILRLVLAQVPGARVTGESGRARREGRRQAAERRDLGLALRLLRRIRGLGQDELAALIGAPVDSIGAIEAGRRRPGPKTAGPIAVALGADEATVADLASLVATIRGARTSPHGLETGSDLGKRPRPIAAMDLRAEILTLLLAQLRETERQARLANWEEARRQAGRLWERLSGCSPGERRALILGQAEFQTAGLCERLCEESIGIVGDDAARAVELAGLAAEVARRVPGEAGWRSRLEGFAGLHEANAVRVAGKPRRSRALSERAMALWQVGAAADPGLLNKARVLQMEAALRRNLRQLPEALALLDRALALDRWGERASLLVSKARTLEDLGRHEEAIALLRQAMPQIDGEREPRKLCAAKQNFLLNLCQLGRHGEALLGLPEVRAMARRLGRLDVARVDWLEGKIALGLGRHEEAIAALERARDEFRRQAISYDTALVTLELAEVHAALGRFAQVKTLALESAPVFREQGIHREARRALEVFRQAAEEERATVDLIRRVVVYLYRARHAPRLRFVELAA